MGRPSAWETANVHSANHENRVGEQVPGYSLASADINNIKNTRVGVQTKVMLTKRVQLSTSTNFGNTSFYEIVDESAK